MKKSPMFGAILAMALASGAVLDKMPYYNLRHLSGGTRIRRSNNKPHQGGREKARRLRQIAEGRLEP